MTSNPLAPARALHQPRRIDRRAAMGIFLAVLAGGFWIAFWAVTADSRNVVLATRELQAGAVLRDGDLTSSLVRVDDAVYAAAVPAGELASLIGRQLAEPAHPQQVLARAQVSPRPVLGPDQVALTIAVSPESAAGGKLRAGDLVEVLLTTNKGKPEVKTAVVLAKATVYDVGYDQRQVVVGGGGSGPAVDPAALPGALRSVTLVVSQEEAVRLAQAKWAGELDVALLPPGQQ